MGNPKCESSKTNYETYQVTQPLHLTPLIIFNLGAGGHLLSGNAHELHIEENFGTLPKEVRACLSK